MRKVFNLGGEYETFSLFFKRSAEALKNPHVSDDFAVKELLNANYSWVNVLFVEYFTHKKTYAKIGVGACAVGLMYLGYQIWPL